MALLISTRSPKQRTSEAEETIRRVRVALRSETQGMLTSYDDLVDLGKVSQAFKTKFRDC